MNFMHKFGKKHTFVGKQECRVRAIAIPTTVVGIAIARALNTCPWLNCINFLNYPFFLHSELDKN